MAVRPIPGDVGLLRILREEIDRSGPMSFARFMELTLHDPVHGYYARGPERLGPRGDYVTASDLGPALGRCLARQIVEVDDLLGRPEPLTYVELGAGRGMLASDVRDELLGLRPELDRRLRLVLADTSPGMRAEAASRIPGARVVPPDAIGGGHVGVVIAVELFDALPVHRLRRRNGRLLEVRVGVDAGGALVEVEGEPSRESARWAERWGAAREDGDEAEACPSALDQMDSIALSLDRGLVLVVDYGHEAADLHDRSHRRGTLLAYHRHAVSEDLLARPGEQDLTAHVNFSALEERARARGLTPLGLTTQDRFLVALGILEWFESEDDATWRDPARVRRRLQAMQLIHPHAMGRAFKVQAFSKGIDPVPSLAGLRDPWAASPDGSRRGAP